MAAVIEIGGAVATADAAPLVLPVVASSGFVMDGRYSNAKDEANLCTVP